MRRSAEPRAYEAWYHRPPGLWAARLEARTLLELTGPVAGLQVLDAGCGTGYFTRLLATQGARAWGVDRDVDRLLLARELAHRGGLPQLFVAGDILSLPFRDQSFDVVAMVTVLEFQEDRSRALAEAARVLRPGGRLAVLALTSGGLWGLGRKLRPRLPYSGLKPLREAELAFLLAPVGPVRTIRFLYAPPWPFLSQRGFFWLDALLAALRPGLASMVGAVARKG